VLRRHGGLLLEKGLLTMKWIFGASILALTLGWIGTATIPAATITPDESVLKYFPPETKGVAFIDVASLRSAPLVQSALNLGQLQSLPPGINDFMESTGFDVRRDLDRLTIGTIGERDRLIVAEAHYDRFKAERYVKDRGAETETYLGREIYRNGDGAFTFLDNVILAGTQGSVKQGLDRITYPGGVQISSDLLDGIRTIEAGNQIWAVGKSIELQLPAGALSQTPAAGIFQSLRRGTYQMRIDQDIHARAIADFTDANAATNLADMARGLIAVAKLQVAKQQPDLVHVLDGIQVSSSGSTVTAQVEEPGDLLMKFPPTFERAR
jgi:hypothetical protein